MEWLSIFRYFYLLGAANALFFSILIFSRPKPGLADKILGYWLIVLSFQLISPFLYLADLDHYYQYAGYEIVFYAFHPLFLYFYIRASTGIQPAFRKAGQFLALALLVTGSMLLFFLIPSKERLELIEGGEDIPSLVYLSVIPVIAYFVFFCVISDKLLRHYKQDILHVFSYRQNVDLLWLRRLQLLFYGLLLFTFALDFGFYIYHVPMALGDYFYFVGLTIFIFLLGYWGYKHGGVFNFQATTLGKMENEEIINPRPAVTVNYSIPKGKARELKEIMETKKPYLNPTLTIYELAAMLDIQPHQLSRLIKVEFQSNFFEFVNSYRIDTFKKLMFSDEYRDFTLLAIALECGFNSKSAFNRIFKEQTGLTPREFKMQKVS